MSQASRVSRDSEQRYKMCFFRICEEDDDDEDDDDEDDEDGDDEDEDDG